MKLNPANKRKYNVIVVGTGLTGASAAATMGELGYNVQAFCFQDSPRKLIQLQLKVASTLQRIIKAMVTVFTDYFMTL